MLSTVTSKLNFSAAFPFRTILVGNFLLDRGIQSSPKKMYNDTAFFCTSSFPMHRKNELEVNIT
jgi:hypothetical protein